LGRNPAPILPDLATAHEQGLVDFDATTWFGFFLPHTTSDAIVRRLHDATVVATKTPSLRKRLEEIGAVIVSPERMSPEYLDGFVHSELAKWLPRSRPAACQWSRRGVTPPIHQYCCSRSERKPGSPRDQRSRAVRVDQGRPRIAHEPPRDHPSWTGSSSSPK